MEYQIPILICGVLLTGIAGWFGVRFIRNKTKESKLPFKLPSDIIEQLDYASQEFERRNIESNGNSNPYEILWEVSKRNRTGRTSQPTTRTEQVHTGREFYTVSSRREDIQTQPTTGIEKDNRQPSISNTNSRGNFFSKFKRK